MRSWIGGSRPLPREAGLLEIIDSRSVICATSLNWRLSVVIRLSLFVSFDICIAEFFFIDFDDYVVFLAPDVVQLWPIDLFVEN